MKANLKSKNRQLRNDENGVSSVIGTIIMIGIVATLMPIVMIAMGNMTTQVTKSMDTSTTAMRICTDNMQNMTDYMSKFRVGGGGSSDGDDSVPNNPFVEYEFNETSQQWDFYYCVSHEAEWVYLTPIVQHTYTLTAIVTPVGCGIITQSPMLAHYPESSYVTLNATPNVGYVFVNWEFEGTRSPPSPITDNPLTIPMTYNVTVYAHFQRTMK